MIRRYLLVWFLLAIVAVLNGVLREATFGRVLTELLAHQLSTLTGMLATGALVMVVGRRWPIESAGQAFSIGLLWVAMTVAFEFGFGHYVAGHSWTRLLADYNLARGRLWALFLVWMSLLPWLAYRFCRPRGRG